MPSEEDGFPEVSKAVDDSLRELASSFRKSPESYLYEADLQGRLLAMLSRRLAHLPTSGEPLGYKDAWKRLLPDRPLAVDPVKAEYPDSVRFDIAVLHRRLDAARNIWNQPVLLAIELKLRQVNGGEQSFHGDREKLLDRLSRAKEPYPFTGMSVVFCHRLDDAVRTQWEAEGCLVDPDAFCPVPGQVTCWAIAAG